ncbi:hypothetical protein V5O48_016781 [Marasmius crinis-equi]|uniref:F-box domain-containing protein n=1 Tax=Marasmius crinis-equi TaxID=585013 RepID=A0ABR3EQT3_9AGAR
MTPGDLHCKIPFELVEAVLADCVHETLLSCSLVCQSWLPSCRPRLFKSLEIASPQRCDQLARILESEQCTIPSSIRKLKFNFTQCRLGQELGSDHFEEDNQAFYCIDYILMISMRLKDKVSSLKKLTIIFDGLALLSPSNGDSYLTKPLSTDCRNTLASQLISAFGHVDELDLQLYKELPSDLIAFTTSFARLKYLKMHSGVIWSQDDDWELPATSNHRLSSSLHTLELGGGDDYVDADGSHLYYEWLYAYCPPGLLNLSVYRVEVREGRLSTQPVPDIQPFLTTPRLRFLHLGFDTWYVPFRNSGIYYDLSAPQHLEELVISIRNLIDDEPDVVLLNLLRTMLNTLTSPRLRRITFNVYGSGFRVLPEEWDALDGLLASEKFSSVAVELVVPFSDKTIDDGTSEEDLPKARGTFSRGWGSETEEDAEYFQDGEVIDWVCCRYWC